MHTTSEIRRRFLEFFERADHRVVPSSPLVPANDRTLLFTNAGMVQFKDVFTGDEQRDYRRAVTAQRCVRAGGKHNDLDNVGYTARHHTFFEMLGNFSFGDYFKEEAIEFAWRFLTGELSLPKDRLWVTVFEEDDEAERIWVERIGVPADRVVRIGAKDNFWMMGDTGPCGPCSEIFYDHGPAVEGGPPGSPGEDGDRYIEIWNLVFMQFDRSADGTLTPLPRPCVDTGMGLERIAAVLQSVHSNYEIDLFSRLIDAAADIIADACASDTAGTTIDRDSPSLKVVADHIRSCAFLIADGVRPGNDGRSYVLRRIIRRAARHGHKLGADRPFFHRLVTPLVAEMGEAYPELRAAADHVVDELEREEERFATTLSTGLAILDEAIEALDGRTLPGETIFRLYDTYGFPVDLTADIARERGFELDLTGFETQMSAQRERARAASSFASGKRERLEFDGATRFVGYDTTSTDTEVVALFDADGEPVDALEAGASGTVVLADTPFYAESGGQVGDTGTLQAGDTRVEVTDTQKQQEARLHRIRVANGRLACGDRVRADVDDERRIRIRRHHSATHLLHAALRDELGSHVEQRGSLVDDHHLRFDFSHTGPIDPETLARIERRVEAEIRSNHAARIRETSMEEALRAGAMALFGEKYGDVVRMVELGERSIELCGGTHVDATGEIGTFRVLSDTGVAAGVRRIEAVGGEAATDVQQAERARLDAIASRLRCAPGEALDKLVGVLDRQRQLEREVDRLRQQLSSRDGDRLLDSVERFADVPVLFHVARGADTQALRALLDALKQQLPDGVLVLVGEDAGKAVLLVRVAPSLHERLEAGPVMRVLADAMGGRGGGRAELAQGGAPSIETVDDGLSRARAHIAERLQAA